MSHKLYFGTQTPLASRSHSVPRRRTRSAYDHFIRESDAEQARHDFKVAASTSEHEDLLRDLGRAQPAELSAPLTLTYRRGKYGFTK